MSKQNLAAGFSSALPRCPWCEGFDLYRHWTQGRVQSQEAEQDAL